MLDTIIRETKVAGFFINVAKTKYIIHGDIASTPGTITVGGPPNERVDDLEYLGSYVGSVDRDIDELCHAASRAKGFLLCGRHLFECNEGSGVPGNRTCYVLCVLYIVSQFET